MELRIKEAVWRFESVYASIFDISMAMREQRLDEGLQELGWKCARGLYIVER